MSNLLIRTVNQTRLFHVFSLVLPQTINKTKKNSTKKMVLCFEYGCSHSTEQKKCIFYRFPSEDAPLLRTEWIRAIKRRDKVPTTNNFLCSCHFRNGQENLIIYQINKQVCNVKNTATTCSSPALHSSTSRSSAAALPSKPRDYFLSTNPFITHGIDKLCTICNVILRDTGSTHSIFSTLEEFESPMNVVQVLQSFSNFNGPSSGPQMVCATCYDKTIAVYTFIQMCNKAHENMQDYLQNIEAIKTSNDDEIYQIEEINISPTRMIIEERLLQEEMEFEETKKNEEIIINPKEEVRNETSCKMKEIIVAATEFILEGKKLLGGAVKQEMFESEQDDDSTKCSLADTVNTDLKGNVEECEMDNIKYMPLPMEERSYKCEICNKTFTRASNLKDHGSTHSDARPFSCQDCGKAFKLPRLLRRHLMTHAKDRPNQCEICNKFFTRPSSLKNHAVTHCNDRPFICQHCGKSFKFSKLLKNHHLLAHTTATEFGTKLRPSANVNLALTHSDVRPFS